MDIKKNQIDQLIEYFNDKKPIPENVNNIFKSLFLKYACIGGFSKAITGHLKQNIRCL